MSVQQRIRYTIISKNHNHYPNNDGYVDWKLVAELGIGTQLYEAIDDHFVKNSQDVQWGSHCANDNACVEVPFGHCRGQYIEDALVAADVVEALKLAASD